MLLIKARHALLAFVLVLGCGGDDKGDSDSNNEEGEAGKATGATCPSSSTLTYDSFGRDFMESYCTRCHSSKLTGDARMMAPLMHDFDSLDGIKEVAEHIDEYAAAGPDATNTLMPPSGDMPSEEDRQKLGEWIACGLKK